MRRIVFAVLGAALLALMAIGGTVRGQGPPPPPPPPGAGTPPPTLSPPCPPTGCATATPTITPIPPTPTATAIPVTVAIKLAHAAVNPRSSQKVTVTTLPNASVDITVNFPNGDTKTHAGNADSTGKLTWSYKQPGSRITHASRTARVSVTASSSSGTASRTKRYAIGFAALDVMTDGRTVKRGHGLGVWVHSLARVGVLVNVQLPKNGARVSLRGQTGVDGWFYQRLVLTASAAKGKATVKAYGYPTGIKGHFFGQTSFRVQ